MNGDDLTLALVFAAFVNCILLFIVIKMAVEPTRQDLLREMSVQNALLRKLAGIHTTTLEELEDSYKRGFYTQERYNKLKQLFKEKENENR